MAGSIHENEPLTANKPSSYNTVLVKNIDEEDHGSSSHDTTDQQHDAEYLVTHRLGQATLPVVIACLCVGGFLSAVDTSIVITVFNIIGTEFKSSNLSVLIMVSYMLSVSAIQPLYGKLSDIFGRKSTLCCTLAFFLIGSLFCGAAQSMLQMAIFRGVAGLGGGGLMTMASVVIHDLIPMRNRGKYQSYVNMAQTIGTTVGAPLGGIINDYFGWRCCFYINIPPCLFILYYYIYKLENYNLAKGTRPMDNIQQKLEKIDFVGAALLLIGNLSFVAGVSFGGNIKEWDDPIIVSLLISSVTFFTLFGLYEVNWAKNPLVSQKLIKNRNVVAVCLCNFFLTSSTIVFIYLVPQYFMGVLGFNASSAGMWVLPRTSMVAIGCWAAGRYLGATGRYKDFLIGIIALQVSAAFGTYLWNDHTPLYIRLLCMNVEGFCFGNVLVATMVALVADIDHGDTASATSMIFLCRSIGWLSGSTITAAILQLNFKKNLNKTITGPEAVEIIEFVRTSITKIRTLAPEVQVVVISSLGQAIHSAFLYGVVCAILCFLAALCMRNCQLGNASADNKR